MKQISKIILAVTIFICLAAASSAAQTVLNRATNTGAGALVILLPLQTHCNWSPDHQGGLQ